MSYYFSGPIEIDDKIQIEVKYPPLLSSQLALLIRDVNEIKIFLKSRGKENEFCKLNKLANDVIHSNDYHKQFINDTEEFNKLKDKLNEYDMKVEHDVRESDQTITGNDIYMCIKSKNSNRIIVETSSNIRAKANFLRIMLNNYTNINNDKLLFFIKQNRYIFNGITHSYDNKKYKLKKKKI